MKKNNNVSIFHILRNAPGIVIFLYLLSSCTAKKGDFDATGVFEATEVIVSAKVAGEIMHFDAQEGQRVDSKKMLGYIDTTQYYLKKQQLLTNRKAVRSRTTNVNTQIAALKQQIESQKNEKKRFENLVKSNVANQKQLDDVNSQLQVLERQLAAQTDMLSRSNTGIYEESTSLEIQVAQLDDLIKNSLIVSPIQGTILTKYAEEGELAVQGKALFKVADLDKMILRVYITNAQLSEIKIGQEVKVFTDTSGKDRKEHIGTVSWVSDNAEFTPKTIQTKDERANLVYAVKIAVNNDGYIKQGMYGEIKF